MNDFLNALVERTRWAMLAGFGEKPLVGGLTSVEERAKHEKMSFKRRTPILRRKSIFNSMSKSFGSTDSSNVSSGT